MVYTTHLWWLGGWFIIAIPTLLYFDDLRFCHLNWGKMATKTWISSEISLISYQKCRRNACIDDFPMIFIKCFEAASLCLVARVLFLQPLWRNHGTWCTCSAHGARSRPKGRVGTPFAPHSSTSVIPLEQFINEQWVIKPSWPSCKPTYLQYLDHFQTRSGPSIGCQSSNAPWVKAMGE